jgi:hypothetical protein
MNLNHIHVKWVRHHGMACQVGGGGDGLQIWRVAANILNKQPQIADKGLSPAWGLGVGLTTHRKKNKFVMKCQKGPQTWTDSLNKRPKLWKMDMRFCTWNVRSLYMAGLLMTVASEISVYKFWWLRIGTSGGSL